VIFHPRDAEELRQQPVDQGLQTLPERVDPFDRDPVVADLGQVGQSRHVGAAEERPLRQSVEVERGPGRPGPDQDLADQIEPDRAEDVDRLLPLAAQLERCADDRLGAPGGRLVHPAEEPVGGDHLDRPGPAGQHPVGGLRCGDHPVPRVVRQLRAGCPGGQVVDQVHQQVVLVPDVVVERRRSDAQLAGQLADGQVLPAVAVDQGPGCRHDPGHRGGRRASGAATGGRGRHDPIMPSGWRSGGGSGSVQGRSGLRGTAAAH